MKITNQTYGKLWTLSRNTESPQVALVTMKQVCLSSLKVLHEEYVVDLMKDLNDKKIPLREVRIMSEKMCRNMQYKKDMRQREYERIIMKWKHEDATKKLRKEKYDSTVEWRKRESILRENGIREKYIEIWKEEKKAQRKMLRKKRRKKVIFLEKKHGKKYNENEVTTTAVEGIER